MAGFGERMEVLLKPAERAGQDSRLAQEAAGEFTHLVMQAYANRERSKIFGSLQTGELKVESGNLQGALPDYNNAIERADKLNQDAIARERKYIQEQLKSSNISAVQRRLLMQEDADLGDLQRAAGVTRANLGLLLIRNGRSEQGTMLLLDAQNLDPQMANDPNFRRHLDSAVKDSGRDLSFNPIPNNRQTTSFPFDVTRQERSVPQNVTRFSNGQGDASVSAAQTNSDSTNQPSAAKPSWTPATVPIPTNDGNQGTVPKTPPKDSPATRPGSPPDKPATTLDNTTSAPKQAPEQKTAELPEAGKAKLQELLNTAEAHRSDILTAKQYYEQAIKQADALYNADKSKALIQELGTALVSGKYKDKNGVEQPVTMDDRIDAHKTIVNQIDSARAPFMVRMIYANALKASHEYADAERVMLEARLAADKLPIDEIRKEADQLRIDSQKPGVSQQLSKQWLETAPSLSQLAMAPIRTRYDLIQFYLAGGKTPEGGIIGDTILNEKKQPQPIDTKILKPDKAMEIINETVKREKELLGIDLEKEPKLDPDLFKFRELARYNAPDNLKKKMNTLSSYWPDVSSDIVAGVVGVGVTLGLLYLAKSGGAAAEEGILGTLGSAASWLGKPGAIGLGLATSIGTRHVVKKDLWGDKSETWTNSLFHGGTSYAAIGAMYLAKGKLSDYYYGNFTPDKVGDLAFQGLAPGERTVGGLAKAISAKGLPLPEALSDALEAQGGAAQALTPQYAGELLESSGQQGATLLRSVFGKVGLYTPERIGQVFLDHLPQSERTLSGMANAFTKAGVEVPAPLAAALNAGEAGQAVTAQSAAQLLNTVGKPGAEMLVDVFGKGASTLPEAGFWSNASTMARAAVRPLSAEVIPSSKLLSPFMASKLAVGTGAAFTYDTIRTAGLSTNDWRRGETFADGTLVTPLKVFEHKLGFNRDNIFLDSLVAGVFLGGVSPVSTGAGPMTAFANARCMGVGPFGSCSIAMKSLINVPGVAFSEADLGQRLVQLGWNSLMANVGSIGHSQQLRYEGKTYAELVSRTNRPISNEVPRPITPARASILGM